MGRLWLCVLLVAFFATSSAGEEPFAARVNKAIERGIPYLKKKQRGNGSWGDMDSTAKNYEGGDDSYDYPAGPTALTLLTLLKCGVPADDPVIITGFEFIERKYRIPTTAYEISALIMALEARANPYKRDRTREADLKKTHVKDTRVKLAAADRKWMRGLIKALEARATKGGWRYGGGVPNPHGIARDISSTQYAMMALFVAKRCGTKVSERLIRDGIRYCLDQQLDSGGWPYIKGARERRESVASGTMTTGGLVILLTGRSMLGKIEGKFGARVEQAIQRGLGWLKENWAVEKNPCEIRAGYHFMYLYGLERVGDLLRVSLIGGHNWYREGGEVLLKRQKSNGRWYKNDTHSPRDILNTCFALLFLDRATLGAVTPKR